MCEEAIGAQRIAIPAACNAESEYYNYKGFIASYCSQRAMPSIALLWSRLETLADIVMAEHFSSANLIRFNLLSY